MSEDGDSMQTPTASAASLEDAALASAPNADGSDSDVWGERAGGSLA